MPGGPFLVAGLGRAGRAASQALLARRSPGEITAWGGDSPPWTLAALAEPVAPRVRTATGGDGAELLAAEPGPRCLVKSPGIPFDHPLIEAALERGIEVIDEAELGWRLASAPMVAVTGTNGKSTVVALLSSVLEAAGARVLTGGNTQFDPPLSTLASVDGDLIVAEISSFQLEGCPELLPEAAVLTNVAPHHLGRHGTVERYVELKRRLFVRGDRAVAVAALNLDDPVGRRLAADVRARGGLVAGFGRAEDADYRLLTARWTLDSGTARFATPAGEIELETGLPGRHNALNAAAALALAGGLGIPPVDAAPAIASTRAPPGRLEIVARAPAFVVVDGALSPHGIAAVLDALAAAADRDREGRLIAVVSALEGVNDAREQRRMGRVARERSDHLIVTAQRWAPGIPQAPPPALAEGARSAAGGGLELVADRAAAIERAVGVAEQGDVVAILGRGARGGPLLDAENRPRPFDDRSVARAALGIADGD